MPLLRRHLTTTSVCCIISSMTFKAGNRQSPDMPLDQSIFGIRAGADDAILPTIEELNAFLESPKTAGRMELHRDELSWYAGMVKAVSDFEAGRRQGIASGDFLEKLYYGVLLRSRFFTAELKTAVSKSRLRS